VIFNEDTIGSRERVTTDDRGAGTVREVNRDYRSDDRYVAWYSKNFVGKREREREREREVCSLYCYLSHWRGLRMRVI